MTLEFKILPTITGRGGTSVVLYEADPNLPNDVDSWRLSYQTRVSDGQVKEEKPVDFLAFLLGDPGDGSTIHLPAIEAAMAYTIARIDAEAYTK